MANVVLVFHEIDIIPGPNNNGWQHMPLLAIGNMWECGCVSG